MMNSVKEIAGSDWNKNYVTQAQEEATTALENGKILLLPQLNFSLLPTEGKFLLPHYADPTSKNISFNPQTQLLRGTTCDAADAMNFKAMLQRFSQCATTLVRQLLTSYATQIQIGRTSFRPIEIAGRVTSPRKDDTRLHVDAFPATPNQGRRILRVFTNINPLGQDRVWRVGEPFLDVAKRFLPQIRKKIPGLSLLLQQLKITKGYRTRYDHMMLQIHNHMKANDVYQQTVTQCELRFPPACSWIVQTDHVSHAAMSGQYVLEQTFYLPVSAMVDSTLSPLRTLEALTGSVLT
jgi:hypothetical protein